MKISEMTTERAADVLCEITPYVAAIATDEELVAELRRAIDPKSAKCKAELVAKGVEKIANLAPIVLRKRKEDVFGILSALNGKPVADIAKQNIIVTLVQVREVVKDKDLLDFFRSCADAGGSE